MSVKPFRRVKNMAPSTLQIIEYYQEVLHSHFRCSVVHVAWMSNGSSNYESMHYALGNGNYGDQKFQKIKIYFMLILERKKVNPFSNGEKLPKLCKQYLVNEKRWQFWAFLGKKLEGLVGGTWNLASRNFRSCFEKIQKTTISSRQPFIVNFTFEICKYFHNLDLQNYLDSFF